MKKTLFTLALASMMLFAFASAGAWNLYDFGDNYFDEHNNTSDIGGAGYPGQGDPYQPNPGQTGLGGERFDIEGLNCKIENGYMYVSLTRSYGDGAYSSIWNYTYGAGDLFFGFGSDDRSYALRHYNGSNSDWGLWKVDSYLEIPVVPGGFGNNAAIRNSVGPWRVNQGHLLRTTETDWTSESASWDFLPDFEPNPLIPANPSQTNGDTWVYEWCFDLNLFDIDPSTIGQINFTTTLECGNDVLKETCAVVPEPGTMILLGMGLLGSGAYLRRRK